MKRYDFIFQTTDGQTIQAYRWDNEAIETIGVIQIAHGMVEHSLRYEPFISFLTSHGFIVYANDHRGHGKSYKKKKDRGFFAKKNGFEKVVQDTALLTDIIVKQQPNLPFFLFGHSMGSLIIRRYIQLYDKPISGVILSGTAGDPKIIGNIGLAVAKSQRFLKGPKKRSPLMDKLIFGGYNKRFSPTRTSFDFLTRDTQVVDEYIKDEDCGFICSTSFYIDLLEGTLKIHRPEEIEHIPKQLPIFLFAGEEDPVGNFGKGVQAAYEQYLEHGLEQVSLKLYEDGRHEMLHELNKEEVYMDVLNWINTIMKGEQ